MPPLHRRTGIAVVVLAFAASLLVPAAGIAQQAQQTPQAQQAPQPGAMSQPGASATELYHVHFVKATPGKLTELIAAYQDSPVPPGEPGRPLVFRHLQGDDWDLLVLSPLGKEETLSTSASAEQQQWSERTRGLRAQHADTFTAGPAWADLQARLNDAPRATGTAGTAAEPTAGRLYIVTTYRSLPGHRDQLASVLNRVAALYPGRRTILQHVEGAPWEFVMLSQYDSWNAIGTDETAPPENLRKQGFASQEAIGTELRQHVAEHRDTIVRLATK